ncbi:MAG: twin-arginine translocase TatA/TatE family subunit [Puniceicoccales bacterium]|jgi:sec-independent protein translocase protein TatA|nr:twin-arginine translocase TatA/TatE family subunit [Puniceicoccales bacterium]
MNNTLAYIWDSNPGVLILILVVVVLLFGANKIPELARGLGKARREFKRASDEIEGEVRTAIDEEDRKKTVEEEERKKIRARLEREERAKFAAKKDAPAAEAPPPDDSSPA